MKPVVRGGGTLVQRIRVGAHDPPARKVRVVLDIEPGKKYTYTRELSKEENILNILLVPAGKEKKAEKADKAGKAVTVIEATAAKQVVITGPKKIYRTGGAKKTEPQSEEQAEPQEPAPAAATAAAPAAAVVATTAPQTPDAVEAPTMSLGEPPASAQLPAKEEQAPAAAAEPAAPKAEKEATPAVPAEAPVAPPEVVQAGDGTAEKKNAEELALPAEDGQAAEPASEPSEPAVAETAEPVPPASEDRPAPAVETDSDQAGQQAAADPQTSSQQSAAEVTQQPDMPAETPEKAPPAEQSAPAEAAAPAEKDAEAAKPELVEVSYENSSSKGEMIFFRLSGFHPPEVTAEESETPQVHCDFADMELGGEVEREIEARGAYVQKIVTSAAKGKVRVSIDLTVGRDYDLRQVFFKEDNLFVLIVNALDEEGADGADQEAEAGDPAAGK